MTVAGSEPTRATALGAPGSLSLRRLNPGDVLEPAHRATVSPHGSPILRGAAYIAALGGDPWRSRV